MSWRARQRDMPRLKEFRSKETLGFSRERFIESNEIIEEFICGICHGVFRKPVVTECCGQTYCSLCINQWLSSNNTCPNDRKALSMVNLKPPSKAFNNLLSNLKIRCEHSSEGCPHISKLEEVERHSNTCEYQPNSKCKSCGITRNRPSKHDCVQSLLQVNKTLENKLKTKQHNEHNLNKQLTDLTQQFNQELLEVGKKFTTSVENLKKQFCPKSPFGLIPHEIPRNIISLIDDDPMNFSLSN